MALNRFGVASRAELLERMRDHIHTVVGRYKGKVKVGDVVNEALADGGPETVLRNSLWLQIIGPDYIAKAFQYAHEADPGAMLRYNDFGLEDPVKLRKLATLVQSLRELKVPLHAIGTQAHLGVSSASFERMDRSLTELAKLGLPVHITELDINSTQGGQRSTSGEVGANAAATQGGLVADADARLTRAYEGVFRAFLILQLTTLYSGHMASESLTLLVMRLSIISGKWKVLLRMPGFTSSVIRALMSTLPRALSTQTMSPSAMPCLVASSGLMSSTSSVRMAPLPVRRVMAPQL